MAQCLSPFNKDIDGQRIPLPCGKCYECRARRVSGWSFRLLKEAERSSSAFFITLTYENENIPRSEKNFKTLDKSDLQKFFKRLRKRNKNKLKYYACGEYGTRTERPHYHIILFNADQETIFKAWKLGHIHIGQCEPASVGYTLKYMSKESKIPKHNNDDRLKEFSLMSKRMGENYLTEQMIAYHKADLANRVNITIEDGKKIVLPRYYRDKIYTREEKLHIALYHEQKELAEIQEHQDKLYTDPTYLSTYNKQELKKELISHNKQRKAKNDTRNTTI